MSRTGRPGLSHAQKAELWQRWKAEESLSAIGRALGKHAAPVFGVIAGKGGFAPVPRLRKSISLSLMEREGISRGLRSGPSLGAIVRGHRSGSFVEIWAAPSRQQGHSA